MEIRTYLGAKPDRLDFAVENGETVLKTQLTPQLCLDTPIMFSAMSYGAISLNVHESLARAATECGTYWNTGEGGLDKSLYKYGAHTIVQVASGRFGVHSEYLDAGAAVEIKIGQGAKPGIGGHLPGEKVTEHVAKTRMIPQGTDALSPLSPTRHLLDRRPAPANLRPQRSNQLHQTHIRQNRCSPQCSRNSKRHGSGWSRHNRHRRHARRNRCGTQSHPRQRRYTHRIGIGASRPTSP